MRIKDSLTPYPILNNYGDDYLNSEFKVDYEINTQFHKINCKLLFKLSNAEIEELISKNKAEYAVHVECSSTCYRKIINTSERELEFNISTDEIANLLEIRTFIVLKEDIKGYTSKNFHPDYEGEKFDLQKHMLLAIGTAQDVKLEKDDRDLDKLSSIIQIVRLENNNKGTLTDNTDNDERILVGLSEEIYELYANLGKTLFRKTALSVVLLPALIIVIERMHMNYKDEDYNSRHWFQVINTLLEKNGQNIETICIENDSLLKVCQEVFVDPIDKCFRELDVFSERV